MRICIKDRMSVGMRICIKDRMSASRNQGDVDIDDNRMRLRICTETNNILRWVSVTTDTENDRVAVNDCMASLSVFSLIQGWCSLSWVLITAGTRSSHSCKFRGPGRIVYRAAVTELKFWRSSSRL